MTDDQVDRVAAEILEALAARDGLRAPAKTMQVATNGPEASPPDLVASPAENLPI
jgi:hypothetical protein